MSNRSSPVCFMTSSIFGLVGQISAAFLISSFASSVLPSENNSAALAIVMSLALVLEVT